MKSRNSCSEAEGVPPVMYSRARVAQYSPVGAALAQVPGRVASLPAVLMLLVPGATKAVGAAPLPRLAAARPEPLSATEPKPMNERRSALAVSQERMPSLPTCGLTAV